MDADALSQVFADSVLPVTIIIGILALFGLLGNASVLYVYKWKYSKCNFRIFVLCLAMVDFFSCLFVFPTEMAGHRLWFSYPLSAAWFCKLKTSAYAVVVFVSSYVLLLISIDRFRKVCRPLGWQINQKVAFRLCLFIFGISTILIIPCPILFGIQTTNITYEGQYIVISSCGRDDKYKDSIWITIYVAVLYYATVISFMVTTMVLYGMIIRKLFCGNFLREIDHAEELKHRSQLRMDEIREDETKDGLFSSDTFLDLSSTCVDEHKLSNDPKLIKIESGNRLCIQYPDKNGKIITETIKYTTEMSKNELTELVNKSGNNEAKTEAFDNMFEEKLEFGEKLIEDETQRIKSIVNEQREPNIKIKDEIKAENEIENEKTVNRQTYKQNELDDESRINNSVAEKNGLDDNVIQDKSTYGEYLNKAYFSDAGPYDKVDQSEFEADKANVAFGTSRYDNISESLNGTLTKDNHAINCSKDKGACVAPLKGFVNKSYFLDTGINPNTDEQNSSVCDSGVILYSSTGNGSQNTNESEAAKPSAMNDQTITMSEKSTSKFIETFADTDSDNQIPKSSERFSSESVDEKDTQDSNSSQNIESVENISKPYDSFNTKQDDSKIHVKHTAKRGSHKHTSAKQRIRNKSLIMFVVTLIFNITTFIYFCIFTVVMRREHIFEIVNPKSAGVLFFFWRLYFINHVINPVVYGTLDPRFGQVLKKSWIKLRRKKTKFSLRSH